MRAIRIFVAVMTVLSTALTASAQIPEAKSTLAVLGLDAGQIEQVMAGQIVTGAIQPASERELVTALAFQVKATPAQIVADLKRGGGNLVDPDMIAFGTITDASGATDFAKLGFGADAQRRAKQYLEAKPGGPLNLSADEIAVFNKLASGNPTPAAVESAVRSQLAARVRAYQQKGLDGIAPYALDGGKQRSPAEELRTATAAAKALKQFLPHAYQMLNSYPAGKPPGTEELYRWTHFNAHGTPTIALQHLLYVPDGQAYLVVQRMFYVSSGFNAEQALAALMPVQGGTVAVYGNRTSTDQVAGFGGGAKRSIGAKLLTSQLEGIFEKSRAQLQK